MRCKSDHKARAPNQHINQMERNIVTHPKLKWNFENECSEMCVIKSFVKIIINKVSGNLIPLRDGAGLSQHVRKHLWRISIGDVLCFSSDPKCCPSILSWDAAWLSELLQHSCVFYEPASAFLFLLNYLIFINNPCISPSPPTLMEWAWHDISAADAGWKIIVSLPW